MLCRGSHMRGLPTISEDLLELFASGVDLYIATRDAQLMPEATLGMGIHVHPDRRTVTLYVADSLMRATRSNLESETHAPIAATLCRPPDHRTVQLKGTFLSMRASTERDRELQAVFRAALVASFAAVGVPRAHTRALPWWPSTAIDVEVTDVFTQTPGPDAGNRMGGG